MEELPNDALSPRFLAAIEATEEAVYNSLFKAATTKGLATVGSAHLFLATVAQGE